MRPRFRSEPTHYLNVDLDIFASVPLDAMVQAMGDEAFGLYVGGKPRKYEAHIELASSHIGKSADDTILGLTRLVQRLPPRHRKTWDSAQTREFNVGIQAGLEPHGFELRLQRRTWNAISRVSGTLVVTIYAPEVVATAPRTPSRRKSR
jgi:hypothetical protein